MMRMAVEMTGAHAHFTFESILGASESLRSALHLAHIAAGSTAPVLLSGETGTGKELFAQAIHNDGPRRNRPFVAINCGAIPKELLESELFGYEEGAFTGAQKGGRPGKFELADTGTLFLDEIGDMPFDMQVKLLRVLQSGEIQRVGGLRTVPVDLRIISATNKDLKQAIAQHQFRADLYYRISTLSILVPPLRERAEDILPLAEHFIRRHELRLNRHPVPLPQETAEAIRRYPWPGNVRELRNFAERMVILFQFIDYNSTIPTGTATEAVVNTREISSAVERMSLLASEKIPSPVKCEFSSDEIKLTCKTSMGKANDSIRTTISGDDVEIGFNNRYLLDAIKNCETDEIRLILNGGLSPMIIKPVKSDDFLYLVVPMRIS